MGNADKLIGASMLLIAAVTFTYYTLWALVTPFFSVNSPIQDYFPPREWAVRIPAGLLVMGGGGVGALVGMMLIGQARKEKAKRGGVKGA